ncbi:hypothetical protein [Tateyamaria sp.]|uniref:hypothetical protein n=1 Tax=Tateyamaria sp. TaxID=1929288 RepID=UPI00329C6941
MRLPRGLKGGVAPFENPEGILNPKNASFLDVERSACLRACGFGFLEGCQRVFEGVAT